MTNVIVCAALVNVFLGGCAGGLDDATWTFRQSIPLAMRGQAPERTPNSSQAPAVNARVGSLMRRAAEQYRNGQLKSAQSTLASARRIDPYNVDTLEFEAQIARDLGDSTGYVNALHAALNANPDSGRVQNRVGLLLFQGGRTEEGIAALRTAIKLEPRNAQFARDLAGVMKEVSGTDAAADVLIEAARRNPIDTTLPLALARLHEADKNWQATLFYYDFVLKSQPDSLPLLRQRARCLYQLKQYERARNDFSICFRADGLKLSSVELIEFGDACLWLNDFQTAQAAFNTISARNAQGSRDVELLRCLCALHLGDVKQANSIIHSALLRWPEDNDLRQVAGHCQQSSDNVEQVVLATDANPVLP